MFRYKAIRTGIAVLACLSPAGYCRGQCTGQWTLEGAFGNSGSVYAAVILPNGDLVVGGGFSEIGGVAANSIARWNGREWSSCGTGMADGFAHVNALAVLPDGDLVAAGNFIVAGTSSPDLVAEWDGINWHSLGLVPTDTSSSVNALTVLPNGDLVAGGFFSLGRGENAGTIARWNGAEWIAIGASMNGDIACLAVRASGELIAGGGFIWDSGGDRRFNFIARWDGRAWQSIGEGLGSVVTSLAELRDGTLVASGAFQHSWSFGSSEGLRINYVASWNGIAWGPLGGGMDSWVWRVAAMPNGDLLAGGVFQRADDHPAPGVARWDGSAWHSVGPGFDGSVEMIAALPGGDLMLGGTLWVLDPEPGRLMRWTTHPACAADYNCSGSLDVQDIFDFLRAWFAGDTSAGFDGTGPALTDLLVFLGDWFAGC